MNLLDMRTIIFGYVVSNAVCMMVVASLWGQSRRQVSGLGYWLADFILQFIAIVLVGLRGIIPDFFSMVVSNSLIASGTFLLLAGLGRYLGIRVRQIHNILYMVAFIAIHSYFIFVQPNLVARNVNASISLVVGCGQCAWLLLGRVKADLRKTTRLAGIVFGIYVLFSSLRIYVDVYTLHTNDFFQSGLYDSLIILTFQMLFVVLTFSLFLMVNWRLFSDLENDIALRRKAEEKIITSEEKFSVAFQNHPDAIVITAIEDGRIIEANESFFQISGHSKPETVGRTTVELKMWAHLGERKKYVLRLQKDGQIQNYEAKFRRKSGEVFSGWISSGVITIQSKKFILSVIKDISEQKKIQETLELDSQMMENVSDGIFLYKDRDGKIIFANPQFEEIFGYAPNELTGKPVSILNAPTSKTPEKVANEIRAILRKEGSWDGEIQNIRKDGTLFWTHAGISSFNHPEFGKVWITIQQDISKRREAEKEILANNERLHALTEILQHEYKTNQDFLDYALEQALLLTKSKLGYIYFYNEAKREFTLNTWSREVMKECRVQDPQTIYQLDNTGIWGEAVRQRKPIVLNDYQASHPLKKGYPEGHAHLKNFMTIPVFNAENIVAVIGMANKPDKYNDTDVLQLTLLMGSVWKIVEQRLTEKALHDSQTELKALFASMQDVVITYNRDGYYLNIATTESQMLIRPPDELLGKTLHEVLPQAEADRWVDHIHKVLKTQSTRHIEYSLEFNHHKVWFDAAVSPLGKEKVIWVARDVTERKLMEEKSFFIGTHDQLTGLNNRTFFEEELKRLERGRQFPVSVVMVDLDALKKVNDRHGHPAGDQLLQRTAEILRQSLRGEDAVARIGGDEFAALLPATDEKCTLNIVERIQENLVANNKVNDIDLKISIGTSTALKGTSLENALANADAKMYEQKRKLKSVKSARSSAKGEVAA